MNKYAIKTIIIAEFVITRNGHVLENTEKKPSANSANLSSNIC